MKTLRSILLLAFCLLPLALCQSDVIHSFTFTADSILVFQAEGATSTNISLGGIPADMCNERCHLLLFLDFGNHGTSDVGKSFLASTMNTPKDLAKFFDLLNNYFPYNLGYELKFPMSGYTAGGGSQPVDLSNKTINDVQMTIARLTFTPETYDGQNIVNVSLTLNFQVLGSNSPNLVTVNEGDIADTYVRNGSFANQNYGSESALVIDNNFSIDVSLNRISYLSFNIPAYTIITKATLKLYGNNNSTDSTTTIPVQVYGIEGTWSESTLTFNNAPAPMLGNEATIFYSFIGTQARWIEFDVTPWVRWKLPNGNGVASFAVTSFISGYAEFSSKEGANPPQMTISSVPVGGSTTPSTTTAPTTTSAPTTTTTPSTTSAPTTTTQPSATTQPTTTSQPVTTTAPSTQAPTTNNNLQNGAVKNVAGLVALAGLLVACL